MNVIIEESWKNVLGEEFSKPYFLELVNTIKKDKEKNIPLCPKGKDIFRAFSITPINNIKVLILGQDPYHGLGQAHGLSFSVPKGIPIPSSLKNIFIEIKEDLNEDFTPAHGDLSPWAEQGVFLLNAFLTVQLHRPLSHSHIGWQVFTDKVIQVVSQRCSSVVFMLWGRFAKEKSKFIDTRKHMVLTAAHPSGLSAHKGFFGCNHFSKANDFLRLKGLEPIDWKNH